MCSFNYWHEAYLHMTLCIFREGMWLESEGKVLVEKEEGATHVKVEGTNLELEKLG